MKMSFWSFCQGLVRRLQQSSTARRPRLRQRPSWNAEALEARTLLSSTPALVADINPGAASSNIWDPVAIGSTTYFRANDGAHGFELWKSDGTAAGTTLVKDINSTSADSISQYSGNLLTNVNGTLFFTADDGIHGQELWKSDGTVSGTTMVEDINPGSVGGTYNSNLINVNGTLFFTANDGFHGYELWKSDGTAAGTVPVSSVAPGRIDSMAAVNGTLFFPHDDGIHGAELWKSDGTEAGTTLVKDIFPGGFLQFDYYHYYGTYILNSSNPRELTNVNGTLFFSADDGAHGQELWESDGTEAGTTLVKDIFPGGTRGYYSNEYFLNGSNPTDLTYVNGTLFFQADDGRVGLWKNDGTAAGTTLVADVYPGGSSNPRNLTNVNGTLFFTAYDNVHGYELWKSNGTAAGTALVKDIDPGVGWSDPSGLTNVNGTLFFTADDGVHGRELWQSNGTTASTVMLADINPGGASASLSNLTNANGTLFFTADDGIHGAELWTFPGVSGAPAPGLDVNGFPDDYGGRGQQFYGHGQQRRRHQKCRLHRHGAVQHRRPAGDDHRSRDRPRRILRGFTYTFSAADAGLHTFSATLRTAGSQSIAAADTQILTIAGTESNILVKPAAPSTMSAGGFPSTTTAGVAHSFTVTLHDRYGNVATGYTGTVHFTSSDARALLPANYTFTSADGGGHTFSATLKTAGTQSITTADTLMSSLKATEGGITVSAAAASRFIITAPSAVNDGVPFNLTLTVQDAYGNVVTGYTGTVRFTSSDRNAKLPANYMFTAADKGVHTFAGLVLRKRGKQTITITEITDMLTKPLTATVVENVH